MKQFVKGAWAAVSGLAAEFDSIVRARFSRRKPVPAPPQPEARMVGELHPAIRRRMQKRMGRKLRSDALALLSPEIETDFLHGLYLRKAARRTRRTHSPRDPGGNSHQRRLRRRAEARACYKLSAVQTTA
ncbi:MAG TPA: hypothetical protein VHW46_09815 [Terracidiphilus sp.]|jgi:hypothetical protein|nr:hypothetical protein [Terracidiphilus sp.]